MKVPALKITSRPATFNRCGRRFSAEPTTILLSDLKQKEIDALKAEKNLVVAEVEIDAPDEAQEGGTKEGDTKDSKARGMKK